MSINQSKRLNRFPIGAGLLSFFLLLIGLVAFNVLVGNLRLRKDFTAEKLYTLSEGSRRILANLEQPVTLTLFFSRSNPDVPMFLKDYAERVQDLLREYALASGGLVRVELRDPQPDTEHEEWAQRYGIEPQPTGMMSPPLYFGLVAIGAAGQEQVLPTLHPQTEARLEYDLTRLITRTVNPEKPVLGVMSTLPVLGAPEPSMMGMPPQGRNPQGWVSFRELRREFDLRRVAIDADQLDPNLSALLIVHPRDLPEETQFAIDQYLLGGGRLIVLLDPFSVAELQQSEDDPMTMMGMGGGPGPSEFDRFLDAWGVGFDARRIVADLRAATRLGGGGRVEENPMFLSLGQANLNRDDIATANLDSIMLPFAGALSDYTPEALTFTPLIQSSDDAAAEVDAMSARFGMQAVRDQLVPDGRKRVLAARLTGEFQTAFPDGPPSDAASLNGFLESGSGTVMLVADTDFLYDDFCIRMSNVMFGFQVPQLLNDNINFFVNTVELLSGSPDLIAIRSRGPAARPFTKVDEIEYRASREWQAREQELSSRLQETRRRLQDLQSESPAEQRLILSPDQQQAIESFREEESRIRRELRNVRRNLRQDIDKLGMQLKFANVLVIPALVIVFGLIRGWRRRAS